MSRLKQLLGSALALAGTLVLIPTGLFTAVAAIILVFELLKEPVQFTKEVAEIAGAKAFVVLPSAAAAILAIGLILLWLGVRLRDG